MGKQVDTLIRRVASHIVPRKAGQSRESAAIAVLKSRGMIKQSGKHLVKVE